MNQTKVRPEFPSWGHVFSLTLKALKRSFISLISPSTLPSDLSSEIYEAYKVERTTGELAFLLLVGPYLLPYIILSIYAILFDAAVFPFLFYLPLYHSWTEQILIEFRRPREASTRFYVVEKSMALGIVFLIIVFLIIFGFLSFFALPEMFHVQMLNVPLVLRAFLYFSVFSVMAFSILLYDISALVFGDTPIICIRDCVIASIKSIIFGTLLNLVWILPVSFFPSLPFATIPPNASVIHLLQNGFSGIGGFVVLILLTIAIFVGYTMMLTRWAIIEVSEAKIRINQGNM